MKKFSRAVLAASVFLSLSVVIPAEAGAQPVEGLSEETVESTGTPEALKGDGESHQSSQGEKIALGVGITAAVLAAAAGGVFWAVQQGIVPNPLPGVIPSPAAPKPKPAPRPAPAPAPRPAPAPAPKPAPAPAPKPAPRPVTANYGRCLDVWNALGRPIYPSDPGFQSKFDRDGDGVGCESDPR